MKFEVLNVLDLRSLASDYGIKIPGRLKSKPDIIAFIKKTLADPEFAEKQREKKAGF